MAALFLAVLLILTAPLPPTEAAEPVLWEEAAEDRVEALTWEERYGIRTDVVIPEAEEALGVLRGAGGYQGDNAVAIFTYLMGEMDLHRAAAVGILTNIFCESSFMPEATGDAGTSYGICQWHAGRWDKLKSYCGAHGLDWATLEGQLQFLRYETEQDYPRTMAAIRATSDDASGAWESARLWCKNFEVPADTENTSRKRGDMAVEVFWPLYEDYAAPETTYIEVPELAEETADVAVEEPWEILPGDLAEGELAPDHIWFAGIEDRVYDGKAQKQSLRVYDHTRLLAEGRDYAVSYRYNRDAVRDPGEIVSEEADRTRWPQAVVTLKGNYSGRYVLPFAIDRRDIAEAEIQALSVLYTGKAQKPVPTVLLDGKKLKNGRDFTIVTYQEEEAAALTDGWRGRDTGATELVLTLVGEGNYTGTATVPLTYFGKKTDGGEAALPQVPLGKVAAAAIPVQSYREGGHDVNTLEDTTLTDRKGEPLSLKLTWNKRTLTDEDVEVVGVEDGAWPGTARILLRGRNAAVSGTGYSFVGERALTFKIAGTSLGRAKLSLSAKNFPYTGEAVEPPVTVLGLEGLEEEDYEVTYQNNILPGTAAVVVTGRRGYTGTKRLTFKIVALPIDSAEIGLTDAEGEAVDEGHPLKAVYERSGAQPEFALRWGEELLVPGTDYTVSLRNNRQVAAWDAPKAPTATIVGKGRFRGKRSVCYTIEPRSFAAGVRVSAANRPASGTAGGYRQSLTVTEVGGAALRAGTDYTEPVYYLLTDRGLRRLEAKERCGEDSVIYVSVTGRGCYTEDTVFVSYKIVGADHSIAKASFAVAPQAYTGSAVLLDSEEAFVRAATAEGAALRFGTDYSVVPGSYRNNVKKGTARVTLRGIGAYGGTKTVSFRIVAKQTGE